MGWSGGLGLLARCPSAVHSIPGRIGVPGAAALEDILHDVIRWFPWVCWFWLLVRVRGGGVMVSVVDGGGPVTVVVDFWWACQVGVV